MSETIVNKVAASKLITFDLEEFFVPGERLVIDIKHQLFQEQILREKDFREFIKSTDWSTFKNKHVAIHCSVDAIVPTWAYMLLASALAGNAAMVVFGSLEDLEVELFGRSLEKVQWDSYRGAKVVIKGCSKVNVPVATYVAVTSRLRGIASSIMYGEPCSTVPIYKKA